jgi:hypothetical protein
LLLETSVAANEMFSEYYQAHIHSDGSHIDMDHTDRQPFCDTIFCILQAFQLLCLPPLQVVRISDGFQPHLVSPEAGLRKLVQESIEMVLDPVSTAVRRVHQVLLEVAR